MKKLNKLKIQIVINILFVPFFINAQQISKFYISMPEILDPVLSQKQRYELLEYAKSGLGDKVSNKFNQQTIITQLDTINNYIQVKNTESSTFEMFLFENNSETVIGVIKTVCSPICQSHINFYNTNWQKHPIDLKMPSATDWLTSNINDFEKNNLYNILSVSFISLQYDPISKNIIAQNNSLEYLDTQEKEKLEDKVIKKDFIYTFQNGNWTKID